MSAEKKILLVDDDEVLRETLAEQLQMLEDYDTHLAGTGAEGMAKIRQHQYDAVLLDVGLPDMDGRDLCRMMRRADVKCPIIMLTGHDTDADTILGLDSGADDYITKPFKVGVLSARLRAQMRRFESSEDAFFHIARFTFHPAHKLLVENDSEKKVRLTEKETAILKYLYRAGERPVPRDTLLDEVWGYNATVTTHTLETHVYRLRQKIELDPQNPAILVTQPGGYRLKATPTEAA